MSIAEVVTSVRDLCDQNNDNRDIATGDDSTKRFPLSQKGVHVDTLKVYVDDVLKTLNTDYTLEILGDLTIVIFTIAPVDEASIVADYIYSDFSDATIEQYLNKYVEFLDDYQCDQQTDDAKIFVCGKKNLSHVEVVDLGNHALSPETSDDVNGIYTFATSYYGGVYINGGHHDIYNAAADLWIVLASRAQTIKGSLGDEKIEIEDRTNREFCISQAWKLRPSKSSQAVRR